MKPQNFKTPAFRIDPDMVDYFVKNLDGNPVHREGNSNEILPTGTVPGLMVLSLAAKAVLQLPEFKEILCARDFEVKFMTPVFRNQELYIEGNFTDSPHKKRANVVYRQCGCEIKDAKTHEVHIRYQISQLMRA